MKPSVPRPPMEQGRLEALITGWDWPAPVLLPTTPSTNDEVARLAVLGAPEGTCVAAEEQTAGRGRRDREWVSPIGAGLWMSVLVRAGDVPKDRWGWIPLLAGLAASEGVRTATSVRADLKWPNDLVVTAAACGGGESGTRKLGGVLSQVLDDDAVVIGIGINVGMSSDELPIKQATSVFLEGGAVEREPLLVAVLRALQQRLAQWRSGDPQLAADYRHACLTIGRLVDVQLPDGSGLRGIVSGVDDDGHLHVMDGETPVTVTAGDVVHATI